MRLSMQRDQESQAKAEHDERNEKVAVMQNGAELFKFSHGGPGGCVTGWRNHKDASGGLSTGTVCHLERSLERIAPQTQSKDLQ